MTLLMNIKTGSIGTLENWKGDYESRDMSEFADATWEEFSEDLREVDEQGNEIV